MNPTLLNWRETYTSIIEENGAANEAMRALAFSMACQKHALTLQEFVNEQKRLQVPAKNVFAPTVLATLSDWDSSWDTLKRLLHLEGSSLERVIVHYAKNNTPLNPEVFSMFAGVVEKWIEPDHRVKWYALLTPEQSEHTIDTVFANRGLYKTHLEAVKKEAIEHCIANVGGHASPAFWNRFLKPFMETFSPNEDSTQRISRQILQNTSGVLQTNCLIAMQSHWDKNHVHWDVKNYAQWISDVIELRSDYAPTVLDSVLKKNAALLQHPVLSSNSVVIDYFIEHGIAKTSGNLNVRNVLNSLVHGEGSPALRERAWVKKLALFGAKPSDVKQMDRWTPGMEHAFNYWMAFQFEKHAKASDKVHTYINRELSWEYERRFRIDLRNPQGFQAWREKCQAQGRDPFAGLAIHHALWDTWEQGCTFYSTGVVNTPLALNADAVELFAYDPKNFSS